MSAYRVGLTGGIGSGKSTVADLFAGHGIAVVDTDVIAHQLTTTSGAAMPLIREEFGDTVVLDDGALNRVAMRQHVFSDPSARHRLESILHPLIALRAEQACQAAPSIYVVMAVPLLVETKGWRERCDRILVLDCAEAMQIERVMARNALSADEVRAILAAQSSRAQRLAAADDVIVNDSDRHHLAARVASLHQDYLRRAEGKKLQANR